MKPEIKEKWCAALRSGKYEQGIGSLFSEGKYCCLGVLTKLYADEKGKNFSRIRPHTGLELLSSSVVKWAGLDCESPCIDHMPLSNMNDLGRPFTEIADLIEKEL